MRLSNRLLALLTAAGTVMPGLAGAQPTTRDHRRPQPPPPATATAGPTEAPPALRDEKIETRAGFVWVRGRWDWRASKWEWIPGHWERARAGKKWREGRWESRNNTWVWNDGGWVAEGEPTPPPVTPPPVTPPPVSPSTTPPPPVGPPPGGWPTSAPPAPKTESREPTRAGFVWIEGAWDWRSNKWEWIPGHWERERAGKKWRAQRWEQRDGRWQRFDGDWEDAGASTPTPVAPPGTRPRREWKLERPVVDRYWPAKGKVGTKVVIRGKNFPATAEVTFGGQPVKAAKVTDTQIAFVIPPNAASGEIAVRAGGRRPLVVGSFEVAAAFDPVAEQKRIEEEQRKKAEELWAARQQKLAKDRAAREAAIRQRQEERAASRERRRAERVAALQTKWERAFLADEETQDELTLHAQRSAELDRMLDLAEIAANSKLAVRIEVARQREDARHEQRMVSLQASFKLGGRP